MAIRKAKPAPNTGDMEVFTIKVNGDDPRWGKIVQRNYTCAVSRGVRASDFQIRPGERKVTVGLFPAYYFGGKPSIEKVVAEIARRNLSMADRAIAETLLDVRKDELREKPIVGICSAIRFVADGVTVCGVGYVSGDSCGRNLSEDDSLPHWWGGTYRFAAVVSEVPV